MQEAIVAIASQLGPWAIFILIGAKIFADYQSRKKEKVGGKDPKDLTREMITQIHGYHFDKDLTGKLVPRYQKCSCEREFTEIARMLMAENKNA
jgi:hypothetical protein